MNKERLLDDAGNAVSLYRSIFKSAVGHLIDAGHDPTTVSQAEILEAAVKQKEKDAWYFQNDNISQNDISHFEEVMLDYFEDLKNCVTDQKNPQTVESCLHELFS